MDNLGKGSNVTTQQSSTTPNAQAAGVYNSILSQAQNVAATPYQSYTGELTAPINAQQTAGVSNLNANAGAAAPYLTQAAGLAGNAAQPITAAQIQQYMSPYTQSVIDATQNQFNNQNARQQAGLTSNAISQGALGGNRVGVAQGVLAGQQQLAQAPVIAGLYNSGYGQAVNTAQGQQQAGLAGAYGLSSIGTALQNAGLSGANAQIGAGTLQQQTQQAQDQARYQQFLQQQAYPFQNMQWLAGIGTGVGSQLGTNTNGTTTAPAPNPLAQIAGLGIAGAGLLLNRGGAVHRDGGGGVSGFPYGMPSMPYAGVNGWVPSMNLSAHALQPSPFAPSPNNSGSAAGDKTVSQALDFAKKWQNTPDNLTMGSPGVGSPLTMFGAAGDYGVPTFMARGGGVHGFAYGGTPMDVMNGDPGWANPDVGTGYGMTPFDDRAGPIRQAIANGDFDPRGANSTEFSGTPGMAASNAGMIPIPQPRPASAPTADDDDAIPAASTPTAGVAGAGMAIPGAAAATPYARDDAQAGFGKPPETNFLGMSKLSPHAKTALMTAGLGMLASRSPFLGVGIGEGGLAGMNAFSASQAAEQAQNDKRTTQAQSERRIAMEAERIAQSANAQTETARHNKATESAGYKPSYGIVREDVDPDSGQTRKVYGWIDPNKQKAVATDSPVASAAAKPKVDADGNPITGQPYLETLSPNRATLAKQIADYKVNPAGLSVRGGHREQAIADATRYNPDYDQRLFTASNRAMSNFYGGPEGRTVRSLNVAIDHLNTLDEAATALKNGNSPALNKVVNYFRQQTGQPVTTNFDSIKQVVSAEIAKAVVGGQTALHDRDDMAQRANNSSSPDQLSGIITEFKKLMAGQMKGLRKQYEVTTRAKNFDDFLEPGTKKELGRFPDKEVKDSYATEGGAGPAASPKTQVINGVTYVNRDGQWFAQ